MWATILVILHCIALPFTLLSLTPTTFLLRILGHGPLPKHVAFIMDGNRRWARSLPSQAPSSTVISGHQSGFQALKRVLDLCLQLRGIEHVTVYAFAIDNFKRKREEVDELMALARQSLIELAGHGELLARHQARLKVVGRTELLPKDVQDAVRRVEDMTRDNSGPTLNICIPYSSRDEMTGALQARVQARASACPTANGQPHAVTANGQPHAVTANGHLHAVNGNGSAHEVSSSADEELRHLDKAMMLSHSPPLDILVRTSGVHRLSDFMLWQITPETTIHFVPTYWPAFGLWDLLPIVLQWQAMQFHKWFETRRTMREKGGGSSSRHAARAQTTNS